MFSVHGIVYIKKKQYSFFKRTRREHTDREPYRKRRKTNRRFKNLSVEHAGGFKSLLFIDSLPYNIVCNQKVTNEIFQNCFFDLICFAQSSKRYHIKLISMTYTCKTFTRLRLHNSLIFMAYSNQVLY